MCFDLSFLMGGGILFLENEWITNMGSRYPAPWGSRGGEVCATDHLWDECVLWALAEDEYNGDCVFLFSTYPIFPPFHLHSLAKSRGSWGGGVDISY